MDLCHHKAMNSKMWMLGFLLFCSSGMAQSASSTSTVLAAGDIGMCNLKAPFWTGDLMRDQLQKDPLAVVLALGDLAYPVGSSSDFQNCYDPAWGSFKDRTHPAPGNHEYGTANAAPYFQYFREKAARGYYSMAFNNWKVISLNSNLKGEAMQAQLNWLRSDLESSSSKCTLAFWHHPLVSSGYHGNNSVMQEAWNILQEKHADLVLVGHDHHYERFAPLNSSGAPDPEGIRQFIVGTGGAVLYRTLFVKAGSEKRVNGQFGVLKLNLQDDQYTWQFLAAHPRIKGKVLDSGSARCYPK